MSRYFRRYDPILYGIILGIIVILGVNILGMTTSKGSKVEIYVDGRLKNVYKLQKDERYIDVDTNLGGVRLEFKDNKVRAITSNSPLKLIVKQGWIEDPGETLIGIPDKMVVKVVGESKDDIDFIIR